MAVVASSSEDAAGKNAGIPKAEFVEDVDEFMSRAENTDSAESVLRRLEEQHSKYKYLEAHLNTKKNRLKVQIPNISDTLDIVRHMNERSDGMQTNFQLADQLYVKADIPPTNKVCLWLGANVMLEYDIEEAESVLDKNHAAAVASLETVETDLGFLRDQTTTIEVNMARVYNWDVKKRQKPGAAGASKAIKAN